MFLIDLVDHRAMNRSTHIPGGAAGGSRTRAELSLQRISGVAGLRVRWPATDLFVAVYKPGLVNAPPTVSGWCPSRTAAKGPTLASSSRWAAYSAGATINSHNGAASLEGATRPIAAVIRRPVGATHP